MIARWLDRLRRKGLRYWLVVLVIIMVATWGSDYVYGYFHLQDFRSALFQWLLDHGQRPPEPKYVKVVLIGDDEFWERDPAGRRPIKRTYLKDLINRLVAAKAFVIALDFDLRNPNPASTTVPKDYEDESLQLIEAIVSAASKGTKFVLATPIRRVGTIYYQDADPYQAYGLCRPSDSTIPKEDNKEISPDLAQAIKDNRNKTIVCGYIYVPPDPLVIPSAIELVDKRKLDSFGLAVARVGWPSTRVFAGLVPIFTTVILYRGKTF
jgi:CHASE2 domain